ncbi:hypothetical protein [Roseomonas marmotae]|nr:hypothetical protein [Roseomonas marmotae]
MAVLDSRTLADLLAQDSATLALRLGLTPPDVPPRITIGGTAG